MGDPSRLTRSRNPGRHTRLGLLVALLLAMLGATCEGGESGPLIHVTLNAIPDDYQDLLVVPPSGFTVDVSFPQPSKVLPETLQILVLPFAPDQSEIDLTGALVVLDSNRAVAMVPPESALPTGSHAIVVTVQTPPGSIKADWMEIAVRNHAIGAPLETHQWVQLDFESDRDGDGAPDFPDDLAAFGLASAADPSASQIVEDWVIAEIVARAQSFYDTPNPSQLPGGDPANLTFSDLPPAAEPFTRICVAGEDPTGGLTIGNVLYDGGNSNPSDVACDDFLPSGVFPREILFYANDLAFQNVFDALRAQPIGTHPLDPIVLGPGYDPGDPAQLARFEAIEQGVATFAQVVATVAAHETGHALGMVAPGPAGGGLYGGGAGAEFTHNVDLTGATPAENLLMNAGGSFSFRELTGLYGVPLPRIRELNFAYLQGRLVLDAAVTGIFPPPRLDSAAPLQIALSGPSTVAYSVTGADFLPTPELKLVGPLPYWVHSETFVSATEVTGLLVVPQLAVGSYDLQLANPDGQTVMLPSALEVIP